MQIRRRRSAFLLPALLLVACSGGGTGPAVQSPELLVEGAKALAAKMSAFTTGDDRSGTCGVDPKVTFDPVRRTRNTRGTFCGRAVDDTWGVFGSQTVGSRGG